MKQNGVKVVILVVALMMLAVSGASAEGQADLAPVRAATAAYHDLGAAIAAGYGLVPGLDYCFDNQPTGGMGYHYINTGILFDTNVDPQQPAALVYTPRPDGSLQLGAVEYLIPIPIWDAAHPNGPKPAVLGQQMEPDLADGVYELHVWLWQQNPAGIFEDWNPKVSCP